MSADATPTKAAESGVRHRHRRRHGWSAGRQRAFWATLGGLAGGLVPLLAARTSAGAVALGILTGAGLGYGLATTLTRMFPLLGVIVGPSATLAMMNLSSFTTNYWWRPEPLRRGGASIAESGLPLTYLSGGLGLLASAISACVLLYGLSRRMRGEQKPIARSLRSLGFICLWITLATILVSHLSPV